MSLPRRFTLTSMKKPESFDTKGYLDAVGRPAPDMRWLVNNVCHNPDLTPAERCWLANQTLPSGSDLGTHAIQVGSPALLDFLLLEGFAPYRLDGFGPIHAALERRDIVAMKKLCRQPAETDEEQKLLAAMLYAYGVATCNAELLSPILQAQPDLGMWFESPGHTPLYAAVATYHNVQKHNANDARLPELLEIMSDMVDAGATPQQGAQQCGISAYGLAMTLANATGDSGPISILQRYSRHVPETENATQLIGRIMGDVKAGRSPGPR